MQDFPILKSQPDLVYLDSAATSLKPQTVIDAEIDYYANYSANIHRGLYPIANKATTQFELARQIVAQEFNCDANEVIFTSGTTAGLNMVCQMLAEDNSENINSGIILSTVAEHHSLLLPLQKLTHKNSLELKLLELESDFVPNFNSLEEFFRTNGKKIKIIALAAISNVLGYKAPVEEICELKLKYSKEAILILDAAQLAGIHRLDFKRLAAIDFIAFSGHKFLAGTGVGVLIGRKELLEKFKPITLGGGMIESVSDTDYTTADLPEKFMPGTPNIAGVIGLGAALKYLQGLERDKLEKELAQLAERLLERLTEEFPNSITKFTLANKQNVGIVSFAHKQMHSHDVADFLGTENIAVRAGHHCTQPLHKRLGVNSTIRASFHIYNKPEDIDALIYGLHACNKYFKINTND